MIYTKSLGSLTKEEQGAEGLSWLLRFEQPGALHEVTITFAPADGERPLRAICSRRCVPYRVHTVRAPLQKA